MGLLWGWGPFAVRPTREEMMLAEEVRSLLRDHAAVVREGAGAELTHVAISVTAKVRQLWNGVGNRICRQECGDKTLYPFTGSEVLAATMVASLLGIDYELRSARITLKTGDAKGPVVWELLGQATYADGRGGPGWGRSEAFDRSDVSAYESQFLIAACRAFVEAIECVVPFRSGTKTRGA